MGKKLSEYLQLNIFKGDKGIWMIYFFLCMVSLVAIYSASSNMTFNGGNHWDPVVSQAGFLLFGFIIIIVVSRIPCKFFRLGVVFYPLVVLLLAYTCFFVGGVNNASRWISLPGLPSFQPSEIAKSVLILTVAVILSKAQREEKVRARSGVRRVVRATKGGYARAFKMVLLVAGIVCCLIVPENFSTAAMLGLVIFVMMFIGNIPRRLMFWTVATAVLGIALFGVVLMTAPKEYLHGRMLTWHNRIEAKFQAKAGGAEAAAETPVLNDDTWQENTARMAIANSNVVGLGVGNSIERDFLPHAESDFIFSIIVEETGLVGALIVIMLYVSLLVRVGRIAQRCDQFFPAYLVVGLGMMTVLQALVNMAVSVGLAPVTGQTLPFISHGGTSIVIMSINVGMIISVSRYADQVAAARQAESDSVAESA